jgi:PAS domain S-box-containing protein
MAQQYSCAGAIRHGNLETKEMLNEQEQLRREIAELEKSRKESEENFFKIFHASSNPMAITTVKEGRIVDLNEANARLGGFAREELIGRTLTELNLLADPNQRAVLRRKLDEEGRVHNLEMDVRTKTGEVRTVLLSLDPITLNDEPCELGFIFDITERKKEAEALRQSEEKYRVLVENSLQGLATVQDHRFVFCSQAFAKISGYSVEELLSLSPPEIAALVDAGDRDLPEVPSRYEHRGTRKDGTEFWVEVFVTPAEYNNKPAIQFACIDITERKRTEEALRRAEQEYRSIFENALEGMFRSTLDGRFIMVNPAFARMLGYASPEEVITGIEKIGREFYADPERLRQYMHRLRGHGIVPSFEFQARRKDGSKIWLSSSSRAVKDPAGNLLYCEGYVEDITERKQADESLRQALDWQEALFEGSRDGIFISDDKMRFVAVNSAACRLTGYSKEELLKLGAADLQAEPNLPRLEALLNRILAGEEILGETQILTKDKHTVDVEFGHRRVLISGVPYVHAIARDITNRKRLEAQFQQAQKMEAIGVLAGGVAHDFNNLISVIKGYTELVMEDLSPDDPRRQTLEQIYKAGQQAVSLTSQLLAFSRRQMLQPKTLNLNETVAEMSTMLRRMIGEDIELAAIVRPDLGMIHADPGQVQQILMNLAVNARDAMPQGGKLTIETANVDLDEEYVLSHPPAEKGPYVMLAISDSGHGMDAATQAHLFEPFFNANRRGKGTGLGLSAVYGIVKQSNGLIAVHSEPGKGTTFKIYFPRVEARRAESSSGSRFWGSETVLVAEDEPSVRALACRILSARGYNVLEAPNGKQALNIAQEYAGKINLVLTDVVMPEMGGRELVSQLEAIQPGIKALYVSGYTGDAIVHHGILDPSLAFLQKPFTIDSLACKVREVMDAA